MNPEQNLVPIDHDCNSEQIYGANICVGCKNACGGCEWSEVDLDTGKIRFQPVPGWTVKKTKDGFRIIACPKFIPLRNGCKHVKPKKYNTNFSERKPVVSIDGDWKEHWYPSVRAAAEAAQVGPSEISKCCKHRPKYHTAGGYRWRYAEVVNHE